MALETGTYISDLVGTNPADADAAQQGSAHLRLIKSLLLATFPAITGAVTATHTKLNNAGAAFASSGVMSATSAALTGALSAASATLSGALNAASAAISGNATVGGTLAVTGTASVAAATTSGHAVRLGQFVTGPTGLNANNYIKLPGGVIIQWGNYGGGGASGSITYPVAFVNGPQSVVASSWSSVQYVGVGSTTSTTGFTWTASAATNFAWLAIGT